MERAMPFLRVPCKDSRKKAPERIFVTGSGVMLLQSKIYRKRKRGRNV